MKKIFLAVLFLIISFINIMPSYASVGSVEKIDMIYKYENSNGNTGYTRNSDYKLSIDDVFTYCVTPGILFKKGDGYYEGTYNSISPEVIREMELISYYGYGYKDHTDIRYYLATQELIHNLLGYTVRYNDGNFDVNEFKTNINILVAKSVLLPSISDDIYLSLGNEKSFIDGNEVLGQFDVEYSDNLKVTVEDNILKVTLLSGDSGEIKFYRGTDEHTKFYLKEDSQTVADFKLPRELFKTINVIGIPSGKVELTDKDRATLEPIEGTKYNLLDNGFNVLETKVTDENGYLIFDKYYEYGTYYIEEVEVKDYPRNEELMEFNLHEDLYSASFLHGNMGSIKVTNVDKYGNALSGKFEVSDCNSNITGFDNLVVGKYCIKQTFSQYGYLIDNNVYDVNITKDNLNQELVIVNYQPTGSLVINNVNEQGDKLKGKFEVTDKSGKKVSVKKLEIGTYYVKQTKVESGYIKDDTTYEIEIKFEDLNKELTIINERLTGSLVINNVNEQGDKLNGTFEVTGESGDLVDVLKLIPGKYYVKQKEVESGYIKDDTTYEVEIKLKDLNKELTIVNKKLTGSLVINNVNEQGDELKGKFEVKDKSGKKVSIKKLEIGTYYVKQTKVESGYIKDDTTYEVEIKLKDLNQELTIVNKRLTGSLVINNVNEQGDKLNGTFEVTDESGNLVDALKLNLGKYYVKQKNVDLGYIKDDTTYEVEIKIEDLNKELTIVNKRLTGSLVINNVNEQGDKLNGTFEVTDESGNLVDILKLTLGKYYVKQKNVDLGYIKDDNTYEVEIKLKDLNKEITIVNKRLTGSLVINNVNEQGDKLNGTFEVTDGSGNLVDILKLIPGKYYVKQKNADLGYIKDDNTYEVEITLEDLNKKLNIVNLRKEDILPKTSSNSNYFIFISLILVFLGIRIKRLEY